jgi:hypothetical protein
MKMLDSYLNEIGKRLPRRSRSDLLAEIRSTLEDMLEDRASQAGQPASEAMLAGLLKEYGSPEKVAASYMPARYLIGPRLYHYYELVMKIVLAAVSGALTLAFIIGQFETGWAGPDFLSDLGKFLLGLLGGLVSAFGNVTLVFAILDRTLPASEIEKQEEWDPASLEKIPDADRAPISDQVFSILFIVAGLVIFNLYPQIIGITTIADGKWTFVPVLSDAFFRYLPWINILGVAEILLNLYLLRRGEWDPSTRIATILIEAGGVVLAVFMLAGPSLVDLSVISLAGTPLAGASGELLPLIGLVPVVVLIVLIIVQSIEVVKAAWKLASGLRK